MPMEPEPLDDTDELLAKLTREIDLAYSQHRVTPEIMFLVVVADKIQSQKAELESKKEALEAACSKIEDLYHWINTHRTTQRPIGIDRKV